MSIAPLKGPVTYARRGPYYLADFDKLMAPVVARWARDAAELFWLAPSTPAPLTAAKVVNWPGADGGPRLFYRDGLIEPIGYCELNPMPGQPGHYWIGHCVVRPEQRGAGLGRLLMELVLEEAFARGAYRVSLMVFPENEAACRCYRSVGFREVGDQYKQFPTSDRRHRMVQMSLGREGYLTARHAARGKTCAPGGMNRAIGTTTPKTGKV
ncbi:MAG: hypothetical protein AMXMBFR83_00390 [Phycisphaerae bacterium]|jgi:ribosomal protein S18 acetylase RimI-like enzyme